jgi:hypothetical protein
MDRVFPGVALGEPSDKLRRGLVSTALKNLVSTALKKKSLEAGGLPGTSLSHKKIADSAAMGGSAPNLQRSNAHSIIGFLQNAVSVTVRSHAAAAKMPRKQITEG